jgi:squalene-associated FAD-dependent desaturase
VTVPHVVVVGGGLAGIAAAVALAESGVRLTLLEARPRLGGATYSFERDGLILDNGQHVFLRCCSAYQGLLERLGQSGKVILQDRFEIPVLDPAGRTARLRRDRLPGPLHLTRALATYPLLSFAERLRAARACLALGRLDTGDPELDRIRLGDWLAGQGQTPHARRVLWDLFVVATLNIAGDDAPLGLAAKVMQTALLDRASAADIGIPAVPLGELHGRAARLLLERRGATVRVGARVCAVRAVRGGGFGVGLDGTELAADGVVIAVPPTEAARIVPPQAAPEAARWAELGTSPIVNLHVVYDRPVMRLPFVAAVNSPVQWVFDRTGPAGLAEGQYLAVSLSAADAYLECRTAELREEFLPALAELFPSMRQSWVRDFFVTRQRQATFRQVPGTRMLRPAAASRLPGLALAGAWTDTGWPDTMEGAVRSGLTAARLVRPAGPAGPWRHAEEPVR